MILNEISQLVLDVLHNERDKSPDPSTKIGALLLEGKRIISVGCNQPFPEIADYCTGKLDNRDYKINVMEHAECNCIRNKKDKIYHSTVLLVTSTPCLHCAMEIVKSGIKHVCVVDFQPDFNNEKWGSLWKDSLTYLLNNGVEVTSYDSERRIMSGIEESAIVAG